MTKAWDDDRFYPDLEGSGSIYDLREAPPAPYRAPRLAGLKSVRNQAGGVLTAPAAEALAEPRAQLGFSTAGGVAFLKEYERCSPFPLSGPFPPSSDDLHTAYDGLRRRKQDLD